MRSSGKGKGRVGRTGLFATELQNGVSTRPRIDRTYLRATCLVDRVRLRDAQTRTNIVDGAECLRSAFYTDVRSMLAEWRKKKGLEPDPMAAYRASGYEARITSEREAARASGGGRASGSYA